MEIRTELYPYEPKFVDVDGGRLAYVDEGPREAEPILLLHGNPTWGFLYRNIIARLVPRLRCIAPDWLGFGRSDKLPEIGDYTLERHIASLDRLVTELDLRDLTVVVHDWAGPIGLGWSVEHPERVKRLIVMNTWAFKPAAHNKVPQPLKTFRKRPHGEILVLALNGFVNWALPFGVVHRKQAMTKEVMRAYRAPFPTYRSRESILAFPRHIPLAESDPAYDRMARTDGGMRSMEQPVLFIWGDKDPVFPPRVIRKFKERFPNVAGEVHFPDASHFLQEDKPAEIADAIGDFVERTP